MSEMKLGAEQPKTNRAMLAAVFLGLAVAINAVATQYLAARLGYSPALGPALFGYVYAPWDWLIWHQKFASAAPQVFQPVPACVTLVSLVALFGALALTGRKPERHDGIHGTAHWASRVEIEATGLLPRKGKPGAGVYVAAGAAARAAALSAPDGPEHIAAIAPTRSGKGVGLVVPTLLSWPHSVVVNDQKGELWNLTSAWRRKRPATPS